jgi:hypothetical protein
MVTVLRAQGLRVVIFTDDHDPAHVHVFGDGETKINLLGPNGRPALVWATGAARSEVRKAMQSSSTNSTSCLRIGRTSMADLTDAEIDAALARGEAAHQTEPRATSVRYDRRHKRVVISLTNGCTFSFPPRLAQGLETATDDQLARVEILGAGHGLHWEDLDADFSVPGLLAGMLGTKAYMARRAGQATSPAKAAAARVNGRKGGRPRRAAG